MSLGGKSTFAENLFIKPAPRWPDPVAPAVEPATVKIAVVGLGYVGAPLAVAFSKHFAVSASTLTPRASLNWAKAVIAPTN